MPVYTCKGKPASLYFAFYDLPYRHFGFKPIVRPKSHGFCRKVSRNWWNPIDIVKSMVIK